MKKITKPTDTVIADRGTAVKRWRYPAAAG